MVPSDWDEFSMKFNADGNLVVTLEGDEYIFTEDDLYEEEDGRVYGYEKSGEAGLWRSFFSRSGELAELRSNEDYYEIFNVAFENSDQTGALRGFVVVGNPTRDLSELGDVTATYEGRGRIDLYVAEGYQGSSNSRATWRSDLTMVANFGDSTISGRLEGNAEYRETAADEYEPDDGVVILSETSFTNAGFEGALDMSEFDLEPDERFTGSYEGSFYGPEANSVAGTISGYYEDTEEEGGTAIGHFGADKQ